MLLEIPEAFSGLYSKMPTRLMKALLRPSHSIVIPPTAFDPSNLIASDLGAKPVLRSVPRNCTLAQDK